MRDLLNTVDQAVLGSGQLLALGGQKLLVEGDEFQVGLGSRVAVAPYSGQVRYARVRHLGERVTNYQSYCQ